MSTHNLCFGAKIRKKDTSAYPSFGGTCIRGYILHGYVIVMGQTPVSLPLSLLDSGELKCYCSCQDDTSVILIIDSLRKHAHAIYRDFLSCEN